LKRIKGNFSFIEKYSYKNIIFKIGKEKIKILHFQFDQEKKSFRKEMDFDDDF